MKVAEENEIKELVYCRDCKYCRMNGPEFCDLLVCKKKVIKRKAEFNPFNGELINEEVLGCMDYSNRRGDCKHFEMINAITDIWRNIFWRR